MKYRMISWFALMGLALGCCGRDLREIPFRFLYALNMVEASGKHEHVPPGDNGKALGPFQIHIDYYLDAKEFAPQYLAGISYLDCTNYENSVKVVTAYLNRYSRSSIEKLDFEKLAKIHNGGPRGFQKKSTNSYWLKVKSHLDYLREMDKNYYKNPANH